MEGDLKKMVKKEKEPFHVIHKVPSGDGPYVRAKHAQIVQKDPETAIVWFWKAINAGDRVDSALKDMAVVMKQLDRTEEGIEAIKSFRSLCSKQAQESLDNVLIDLYKKCGNADEQIILLKHKLRKIYLGEAFNGKPTKTARSHGKKFQVSVKQETSRILGNLGWAYIQKGNYMAAEVVYRKAQMIDPDTNKACNLCQCLIKQGRYDEANLVLQDIWQYKLPGFDDSKSRNRAEELLLELQESGQTLPLLTPSLPEGLTFEDDFVEVLERVMNEWAPARSRRLPIFEQISQHRDQLAC
ncbi:SULFUR DEFICIENCY-INDUCED 1-like [Olea europaea subsp. europaea]|uniref:SULFUR DEFICIENCY-INDUCED 1-like n=2 Tax=Olea europaea subsp. europaea TaxID=158383 RepID=A0A8S0RB36_OLEEU|nr:SULFUR DEFICIENCY-INDUCED 1-like [Olea europaea subsp. europaea]